MKLKTLLLCIIILLCFEYYCKNQHEENKLSSASNVDGYSSTQLITSSILVTTSTSLNALTTSISTIRKAKVITKFVDIPSILVKENKKIFNHSVISYFDTVDKKKLSNEKLDLFIFLHGGDKGTPINMATPPEVSGRSDSIHAEKIIQRLYDDGIIDDTFVCVAPMMYLGSGNFTNRGSENWGDFVAISLVEYMKLNYNAKGKIAITGICEGGMSSMKLIIWYPYTISYVGSMSGFFFQSFIEDEFFFNFKHYVEKIYIGIGKSDPFLINNRRFKDIITQYNQNILYDETEGTHPDFNLWKYEFEKQIKYFFGKNPL